ncbi:MAG: four helix bundle protein [Planctomycetota bacterium]|nr:four helix bundle protein [Planctomycetota bacterium]MDA1139687.1 four helix bundle protein [Planctomycetota bacterium]
MSIDREETFEDLETYKVAREFRKRMYKLASKLPEMERFNLISQFEVLPGL